MLTPMLEGLTTWGFLDAKCALDRLLSTAAAAKSMYAALNIASINFVKRRSHRRTYWQGLSFQGGSRVLPFSLRQRRSISVPVRWYADAPMLTSASPPVRSGERVSTSACVIIGTSLKFDCLLGFSTHHLGEDREVQALWRSSGRGTEVTFNR